jgi:hypothetical protein
MTLLRGFSQTAVLIALLCVPQAFWVPSLAVAAPSKSATDAQAVKTLTLSELEHGVADRLKRVDEFRFIEQEAAKLGVHAWLFGGTAAGYAHYVKWDMQRERGDKRFQPDRFDYDYSNIYRSTQDLDIVIDGDAEQAQKLQNALQAKYPHLQGSKTAWEVRLLTQDMGDKQAILNNPDFMNQHTDSNSTGLIEITKPKEGESVVRDVMDWNSKEPYFLKDVQDGMLHYYFSPSHGSTKFAKDGRNPPILSAIRYLTKAFQYELEIRPEDLARLRKVIEEFDPKLDTQNAYVSNWIEKNGKKLIQNAVNIEYAKNTLNQLGLREKLQAIKGNVRTADSLAWWMNKEPLRSHPVGQGSGKTAKELGLDIVAHETNNFLAYESITRAHTGDPNVFISRKDAVGEAAAQGDGFYTKTGKEGARGTGLTIRFHLDPNARAEKDFQYLPEFNFVIIKNKAAVKVIPESLNVGMVEYFQALAGDGIEFDHSDFGIFEKLKRRIDNKRHAPLSDQQAIEIHNIVRSFIEKSTAFGEREKRLLKEWMESPSSADYPDIIDIFKRKWPNEGWIFAETLRHPAWEKHSQWFDEILSKIKSERSSDAAFTWYVLAHGLKDKKREGETLKVVSGLMEQPDRSLHLEQWFSLPISSRYPQFMDLALAKGIVDRSLFLAILFDPNLKSRPDLYDQLLKYGHLNQYLARNVLSKPEWKDHPDAIRKLIETPEPRDDRASPGRQIAQYILSEPHWKDHPELVELLIKKGTADRELVVYVLTQPHWNFRQDWAFRLLEGPKTPFWIGKRKSTLEAVKLFESIGNFILANPQWMEQPQFIEKLLAKGRSMMVAEYTLKSPHSQKHPEFVVSLIESLSASGLSYNDQKWYNEEVFSQPHWKNHPALRRLTGGLAPTYSRLVVGVAREKQGKGPAFSIRGCIYNVLHKRLSAESYYGQ